jgi:hypothetical protein
MYLYTNDENCRDGLQILRYDLSFIQQTIPTAEKSAILSGLGEFILGDFYFN